MATWHVWGDYVHTVPDRIGTAEMAGLGDAAARTSADASGFDLERRIRNGFESWAATFHSQEDDGVEFAFASYPTVRGWRRL